MRLSRGGIIDDRGEGDDANGGVSTHAHPWLTCLDVLKSELDLKQPRNGMYPRTKEFLPSKAFIVKNFN